jgi:hypothetical protein
MIKEIFVPPLDTRLRLTRDWHIPNLGGYGAGDEVMTLLRGMEKFNIAQGYDKDEYGKWLEKLWERKTEVFARGTVFDVKRYHIGQSGQKISLKFVSSPDMPKLAKKSLYVTVDQFNSLREAEIVE